MATFKFSSHDISSSQKSGWSITRRVISSIPLILASFRFFFLKFYFHSIIKLSNCPTLHWLFSSYIQYSLSLPIITLSISSNICQIIQPIWFSLINMSFSPLSIFSRFCNSSMCCSNCARLQAHLSCRPFIWHATDRIDDDQPSAYLGMHWDRCL